MFSIACLVDDKKLAEVLRSLGHKGVYNLEVKPVTGAEKAPNGKIRESNLTQKILDKWTINSSHTKPEIATMIETLGGSPASTQSFLARLQEHKLIKRVDRGVYKRIK